MSFEVKCKKFINDDGIDRHITTIHRKPGDEESLYDYFRSKNINLIFKFSENTGHFGETDIDIAIGQLTENSTIVWVRTGPGFTTVSQQKVLWTQMFQFRLWTTLTSLDEIVDTKYIKKLEHPSVSIILDNTENLLSRAEIESFIDAAAAVPMDAKFGGGEDFKYNVSFIILAKEEKDELYPMLSKIKKDKPGKKKKKKKK